MSFQTHPAIPTYQNTLARLKKEGHVTEAQTRRAFGRLLEKICDERGYLFVEEYPVGKNGRRKVDGAVRDEYSSLGYWEAKDEKDALEVEIKNKISLDYPVTNTIFEDTKRAILWQNAKQVGEFDLGKSEEIGALLDRFFGYSESDREGFESAVRAFIERVPELARALKRKIDDESENVKFKAAFGSFLAVCKSALNPNIKPEVVKEMLIQHLLTERLFKTVFQDEKWFAGNIIAGEIEGVIAALTSAKWNRADFLKSLDPFFKPIEDRARSLPDYREKQAFLNSLYERFFQGYSLEIADTMGIVYTPQPLVDWMCASMESVLQSEFGKSLGTSGVQILDPCTGTGNFIVNLMRRIPRDQLPHKYRHDLFANELMLLPYYVASGNIEHEYFDILGQHQEFEGLCFQDTLDLGQSAQMGMFAERNTERIARQKAADLTVILGNPPYNVGQKNENDNNKNRDYRGAKNEDGVDDLIRKSYAKLSRATNKNSIYDAYVRFFKWAEARLENPDGTMRDGVICFVTNNSFVDQHAFDGMRASLGARFNHIWHLDLHGNVRKNPKLSGTTHNVFGIQVGVGVTILVRNSASSERFIRYHRVPEGWRNTEKLDWLAQVKDVSGVEWQTLAPNAKNAWLTAGLEVDFDEFVPLGSKEAKASFGADSKTIFGSYCRGVETARDDWVYDFQRPTLEADTRRFVEFYNSEVERWKKNQTKSSIDDFVSNDSTKIKWSSSLKEHLKRGTLATLDQRNFRTAHNSPFCKQHLYFDEKVLIHRPSLHGRYFPTPEADNRLMAVGCYERKPFTVLMTNTIPDLNFFGDPVQCFPLYTYSVDGSERFDNITGFAWEQARQLGGDGVTREDLFYAVYALLHAPDYRQKFAENLRRELPRLPLADVNLRGGNWDALVRIGRALGDLHVEYKTAPIHLLPLRDITPDGLKFSFHVERMRWNADKTVLKVNSSIELSGFTPEMFGYKLGNRSALDWVVESYRVKRDERSGLESDPNRSDEPRFILDLIGRVASVSLETVRLVGELPRLFENVAETAL